MLGLVIACMTVFLALFIVNYFDYIKKMQEYNYVDWDVKTITAGDYTVEFDISPDFFEEWLNTEADNFLEQELGRTGKTYIARADAFRDWFTIEMENRLSQLPDLGFEEEPVEEIKIAVTTFSYRNGEVIKLLRKRGQLIKSEDWKGMELMDSEINNIKSTHLQDFTTPCSIFMTFECEEGVNRALRFDQLVESDSGLQHLTSWLGKFTIDIQKASEPTDIIWENRQHSESTRFCRSIVVYISLIFLLACSFLLILICS